MQQTCLEGMERVVSGAIPKSLRKTFYDTLDQLGIQLEGRFAAGLAAVTWLYGRRCTHQECTRGMDQRLELLYVYALIRHYPSAHPTFA